MTAADPGKFGADEIARARAACLKQDGSIDTAIDPAFLKRVTAGVELIDLLDACARGPQSNLFLAWSKKGSALLPAYQVYLTLLAGGDSAVDSALDHPVAKARKRAPSRKNVALLAITLSHNPASPEDQKAASDYACVLIMAAVHTIEPSRFLE